MLSSIRTDDLAAHVIRALMDRHDFDPTEIDDVILGCANQAGEDKRNVARMSLLLAELPFSVPGETVNRLCASGMSAVIHSHRAIQSGDGDLFISGGVEHMTRSPWVISKSTKPFGRDAKMYDEEHQKLIEKYPSYCWNGNKTIKRDVIGDVIDIKYRWRKAFKDGSK